MTSSWVRFKSRVPSLSSIFLCLQLLSMKLMLSRCGRVKGKFIDFVSYKRKMGSNKIDTLVVFLQKNCDCDIFCKQINFDPVDIVQ